MGDDLANVPCPVAGKPAATFVGEFILGVGDDVLVDGRW